MTIFEEILGFFGGLGIFLFGTHLLSRGLQQLAVSKMRVYMTSFTNTRIKGLITGLMTTFFLQSSTVTSILVVGLVGSSVLTLSQALGVILGSAVGTTLTVQVLTFDITKYASIFIFLGAISALFIKSSKVKTIGQVLIGFGFIFFGIGFITSSLEPLSENHQVVHYLVELSSSPVLFAAVGIGLTALLHSSAAMIIIGISFVATGVLSIDAVIPLVLGANVGATIPVLISSISTSAEGKKVAFSHVLFKLTGFLICLFLLPWVTKWVHWLPGDSGRQIANFHSLFNVGIALLFLPLLPVVSRLMNRFVPQEKRETAFQWVKLNEGLLTVPEEALVQTKQEMIKLANYVREEMIQPLPRFLEDGKGMEEIYEVEKVIDQSYVTIQQYLLKLGQEDLSNAQSDQEVKLLYILNDIEHIGDTVTQFLNDAEKISENHIMLNSGDRSILEKLLGYIDTALSRSIHALEHQDEETAKENVQSEALISQFETDLKFNHFNSLIDKNEYDPGISAVYLDVVNHLLRVYQHSLNISRTVLGLI